MENKEIGERIAYLRVVNHYTREALAEKIGITPKFLYDIETGKKGFSARTLYMIAKSLGVSCDYIITGVDGKDKLDMAVVAMFEPQQQKRIIEVLEVIYDLLNH